MFLCGFGCLAFSCLFFLYPLLTEESAAATLPLSGALCVVSLGVLVLPFFLRCIVLLIEGSGTILFLRCSCPLICLCPAFFFVFFLSIEGSPLLSFNVVLSAFQSVFFNFNSFFLLFLCRIAICGCSSFDFSYGTTLV